MSYGVTGGIAATPRAEEPDRQKPSLDRLAEIAGAVETQLNRLQSALDRFHGVSQLGRKGEDAEAVPCGYHGQINRLADQSDRLYNLTNEIELIL